MEDKCLIYVCKHNCPFYSLEVQEKACKEICKEKELSDITVITDDSDNKKNLKDFLFSQTEYQYFITFSFSCLGNTLDEVMHVIKKLIDIDIKIIAVMEPANLSLGLGGQGEKMVLGSTIAVCLHSNMMWKKLSSKLI